jgi:hypothetical protein
LFRALALLDEGDGLQPVRLNVKMNRLQPLRVLLRTEKQCPQGLKPSKIVFFVYGLKPVPFIPFHSGEFSAACKAQVCLGPYGTTKQAAKKLLFLKGTAFRPYANA